MSQVHLSRIICLNHQRRWEWTLIVRNNIIGLHTTYKSSAHQNYFSSSLKFDWCTWNYKSSWKVPCISGMIFINKLVFNGNSLMLALQIPPCRSFSDNGMPTVTFLQVPIPTTAYRGQMYPVMYLPLLLSILLPSLPILYTINHVPLLPRKAIISDETTTNPFSYQPRRPRTPIPFSIFTSEHFQLPFSVRKWTFFLIFRRSSSMLPTLLYSENTVHSQSTTRIISPLLNAVDY